MKHDYYNENDTYLFTTPFGKLKSKVHFEKGYWWTNEKPQYKADSLHSEIIISANP